ncbi:VOC family protein [Nannocystis bainbridge]|uniref:VOC family protein n=1 Tax=Nannocystis bainbridge TaxID=2995303 RepID=A0ABT5DQR0_9BACT|nr:VOC family protein [Nannocystis bainbridge]MDC0715991.1 VOC family protein [Nannocystis bainbridge]
MTVKPSPIPPGPRLIPTLVVADAGAALDFYVKAFGAEEILRLHGPGGRVEHAEFSLFGGVVYLGSEWPSLGFRPPTPGHTAATVVLNVEDVDAFAARAVAAGATLERPVADEFYGDRVARLRDPFGHAWAAHARVEEVALPEMQRRLDALYAQPS